MYMRKNNYNSSSSSSSSQQQPEQQASKSQHRSKLPEDSKLKRHQTVATSSISKKNSPTRTKSKSNIDYHSREQSHNSSNKRTSKSLFHNHHSNFNRLSNGVCNNPSTKSERESSMGFPAKTNKGSSSSPSSIRKHSLSALHRNQNKSYSSGKIMKNSEKYSHLNKSKPLKLNTSDASSLILDQEKIVKKLRENYKIPKNPSASQSSLSPNSSKSSASPNKSSQKDKSISSIPSNHCAKSNSSDNRSSALNKAKQFLENNEKLYPNLRSSPNTAQEHKDLNSMNMHFNSTQWSLEDRLSLVVQQISDLKLELKVFDDWSKSIVISSADSNSSNRVGLSRKKATFHSFEKFHKKCRQKERKNPKNCRCTCSFSRSTCCCLSQPRQPENPRELYYRQKLNLFKNDIEPCHDCVSQDCFCAPPLSSPPPAEKYCNSFKTESPSSSQPSLSSSTIINDKGCSKNWALISQEHAFKAFSSTYQTTFPKVTPPTKPENSGKKKSKKKRTSEANKDPDAPKEGEEQMTLFSLEKWNAFVEFMKKFAFTIRPIHYESIEDYLKFSIRFDDNKNFFFQLLRDRKQALKNYRNVRYQSESEEPPEQVETLPIKRRRRSSSRALEYQHDQQGNWQPQRKRNGSANKSDDLSPPIITSTKSVNSFQTDLPLLTRNQTKYLMENVMNGPTGSCSAFISAIPTQFKDINDIKQHLLHPVTSIQWLQHLAFDILRRQPMIKCMKILSEFMKFKSKIPREYSTSTINSPTSNLASSSPSSKRNPRRKRKRGNRTITSSPMMIDKSSQSATDRSLYWYCPGVECSTKLDVPFIGQIFEISNAFDFLKILQGTFYYNATGEFMVETAMFFAQLMPKLPFFLLDDDSGTTSKQLCGSPRRGVSNTLRGKNIISSPSKCEMKLRPRSSSSSSTSCFIQQSQEFNFHPPESSVLAEMHQSQDETLFIFNNKMNEQSFQDFMDLSFRQISEKSEKKKRIQNSGNSKLKRTTPKMDGLETSSEQIDPQINFFNMMILHIISFLRPLVATNHSKLSKIAEMIRLDHYLYQLEPELEGLDFKVMDLYHQYLYKGKRISESQKEYCLSQLDHQFELTQFYMRASLYLTAIGPNSQRKFSEFCPMSSFKSLLNDFHRSPPSYFRDIYEKILQFTRDSLDVPLHQLLADNKITWPPPPSLKSDKEIEAEKEKEKNRINY